MTRIALLVVLVVAAGCMADGLADGPAPSDGAIVGPPSQPGVQQPDPQLVQACSDAGLWRVDVFCWHHIESSRSVYVDVAAGAVIAPTIVDLWTQVWSTPSGVSGAASLDSTGACRISLSWPDASAGTYDVAVYPHPGNSITGAGTAGGGACEVSAYRQACLLYGPADVVCHGSS